MRRSTYVAAALVLLLALSEAVGRYAFGLKGTAGFLNPWTGPVALVAILVAFSWLFPVRQLWRFAVSVPRAFSSALRTAALTRSIRPFTALLRARLEWLLVITGAISIVWAVFTAVSASPLKGLRDLVYLWLMSLVFVVFTTLRDRGLLQTDWFVQALAVGFFVIIPLISLLVLKDAYAKHRYSGLLFSPSVFAVVSSLLVQLSVTNMKNRWWRISVVVLGLALIGLSGTRSPFVAAALFIAVSLFARFFGLRVPKYVKALAPVTLVAAAAVVYFGQQLRVFQFTDWKSGSIPTRLSFYKGLISDMRGSWYIGGYTPGSAEARASALPHFDLLRFWHDYSVFGMLLWLLLPICMFYVALRHAGAGSAHRRLLVISWAVWLLAMTVLVSAHNIFQTPIGVVVFAVFLALVVPRPATYGTITYNSS